MRIQLRAESTGLAYLPGLARPITIDSDGLAPDEARELEHLVRTARFFELPSEVGAAPSRSADVGQQALTVEDGGRSHTVRVSDVLDDPHLEALIAYIRARARRRRRGESTTD